jgi:hypothetical protein
MRSLILGARRGSVDAVASKPGDNVVFAIYAKASIPTARRIGPDKAILPSIANDDFAEKPLGLTVSGFFDRAEGSTLRVFRKSSGGPRAACGLGATILAFPSPLQARRHEW